MRTFFMGVRAIRLLILAIVVISGIISYFQKKHTDKQMQPGQMQGTAQTGGSVVGGTP